MLVCKGCNCWPDYGVAHSADARDGPTVRWHETRERPLRYRQLSASSELHVI